MTTPDRDPRRAAAIQFLYEELSASYRRARAAGAAPERLTEVLEHRIELLSQHRHQHGPNTEEG